MGSWHFFSHKFWWGFYVKCKIMKFMRPDGSSHTEKESRDRKRSSMFHSRIRRDKDDCASATV